DMLEHQPQVLCYRRSLTSLHLRDDASAAQRAAGVSRLVPHALVRLLRLEDFLTIGESDSHPLADRVRVFARERENVGQEGFDALIHRARLWPAPDRQWHIARRVTSPGR